MVTVNRKDLKRVPQRRSRISTTDGGRNLSGADSCAKEPVGPVRAQTPTVVLFQVSRFACRLLIILIAASWVFAATTVRTAMTGHLPITGLDATGYLAVSLPSSAVPTEVPPWGRLQYERVIISPPLEYAQLADPSMFGSDWYFPMMQRTELADLLAGFGLTDMQQKELLSMSEVDDGIHRQRIRITNEMIESIPLEIRANIYKYLQEDDTNFDQANAFRFCGSSVDEWFDGIELRPELLDRVKRMVFRNGSYLLFADLRLVRAELRGAEEKANLLKALGRDSTIVMSLHFDEQSDTEQLVRYWGRHGRAKDVRPLIESLALQQGGGRIDVSHLLPMFARRFLYTYPKLTADDVVGGRDCHWSAYNFLNVVPDDRLVTEIEEELPRLLKHEFYRVFGDLRLGDVIAFVDKHDVLYHSAVFIADDVVFTKNGQSSMRPWHFRRLAEMKDFYCRREAVEVIYYRRKTS